MHCDTKTQTLGWLIVEKNRIDVSPPYQRESGVWSVAKQQLFIDSLVNRYDIPKLYFNDLRQKKGEHQFAVIDGKQRLHALWSFIAGDFALSEEFVRFEEASDISAKPGDRYTKWSDEDRERFKSRGLDVVYVHDADAEDIEELFARLNNGEALNAAEKRNAMGGYAAELIRNLAGHKFFAKKLPFKNKRFNHYEIAAKFLRIEESLHDGGGAFVDLKKRHLDALVSKNKKQTPRVDAIEASAKEQLNAMARVFDDEDRLLAKQSYPQLYYLFLRTLFQKYGHASLMSKAKKFLNDFELGRLQNYEKPEDERDPVLVEYSRRMQQGTNDASSMEERNKVLLRTFLSQNPDVKIKDATRQFTDEEKWAIWTIGGKICAGCKKAAKWEDFDADHTVRYCEGGPTTIANGRVYCVPCNRKGNKPLK